jgi:fructose-bisphosphate aldolase class II/tagatose 1,6-diphosphate aldolase GatY/KbaY
MTLARGTEILHAAWRSRVAVAAFTTYTLESTRAVCEAGASADEPVILQAGSSSFFGVGRAMLAAAALAMARDSPAPVGVHLDHANDMEEIRFCIDLGYSSVMIDGSRLAFEENIELTKRTAEEAHASGVWVEGELGAIAGDENTSADAKAADTTNPSRAEEFVERTGIDALAVAIGNVHGMSDVPVHLDTELLLRIASAVPIPLVLHGASGLIDSELREVVRGGVAKVNFNAELRRAYLSALRQGLEVAGDDVTRLQVAAVQVIAKVATEKIQLLR